MNVSRVAALLRLLADELEKDDPEPKQERPREPPKVDDIARAKARKALRRLGEPV